MSLFYLITFLNLTFVFYRGRIRRGGRGGHVPQSFFRPSPGQKFVVTHSVFDLFEVDI